VRNKLFVAVAVHQDEALSPYDDGFLGLVATGTTKEEAESAVWALVAEAVAECEGEVQADEYNVHSTIVPV
jgi:hypothetical protein